MRRHILLGAAAALLLASCGLQSGNPVSHETADPVYSGSLSVVVGPDVQTILSMPGTDPDLGEAINQALSSQSSQDLGLVVDETVQKILEQRPISVETQQTRIQRIQAAGRMVPGEAVVGDFAGMLKQALEARGIRYIVGVNAESQDLLVPLGVDGGGLIPMRIETISASFIYDDIRK